jgi:hypothetical protein
MADLTIAVMGVYFDQMLRCEKLEEFRVQTDYWRKRLVGRSYDNLVLTRGYPKGGGIDFVTRLKVPYRGYRETEITHEHFGSQPVKVFAIRVR